MNVRLAINALASKHSLTKVDKWLRKTDLKIDAVAI